MLNSREVLRRRPSTGCCADCGGDKFVTDPEGGEIVCRRCGLVLQEEMLDQAPEWRAYTPDEREERSRSGPPTSLTKFDKGLSTTFQPYKEPGRLPPMMDLLNIRRLWRWGIQARVQSSVERNLSQAMGELRQLSDTLHIPKDVRENAALIYRRTLKKRLVQGRSIKSIVAASLYAACRLTRTPRTLKQIVEASTKNRKEVTKYYRLLQRELNLTMPVDDSIKYVPKISSKVGTSQKTQNLAIALLHKARTMKVDIGKNPVGMAATALYIAARRTGENTTQKKLATAAAVTEVTLRNRCKALNKILGLGLERRRKNDFAR